MVALEFVTAFQALTGHEPYNWQERLHADWFVQGKIPPSANLPTGTGKTSIMAIWLLALAGGARLPRRLVWVVDRRVVVDQATTEAEKLREALDRGDLQEVKRSLQAHSASGQKGFLPLAISTLRGEYEDNREWSEDPSRPAILVGTIDMIGSRLLFSGYGDGSWQRPFHAGLLGTDSLIVLDEAHLSVPFERLLKAVCEHQRLGETPLSGLRYLPISATLRPRDENGGPEDGAFSLGPGDWEDPDLSPILRAPKTLRTHLTQKSDRHDSVVKYALSHEGEGSRVVVYLASLDDAKRVSHILEAGAPGRVRLLTGTMRGHERDAFVKDPAIERFARPTDAVGSTVYLVSTSAGEVGINLFADHMVADVAPLERMVQRFGRVNRGGLRTDTVVDIIAWHHMGPQTPDIGTAPEGVTLAYLKSLSGVSAVDLAARPIPSGAVSEAPPSPPLRPWLLDAWSMTTLKQRDWSGRPEVAPWLRGAEDNELPDVYLAWREDCDILADSTKTSVEDVELILDAYPLRSREILRESLPAAKVYLQEMARRHPSDMIVILSPQKELESRTALGDLVDDSSGKAMGRNDIRLEYRTLLLPTRIGGLGKNGVTDPDSPGPATDVSAKSGERTHGLLSETDDQWTYVPYEGGCQITGATNDKVLAKAEALVGDIGLGQRWKVGRLVIPVSDPAEDETDSERRFLVYLAARRIMGGADEQNMFLQDHLARAKSWAERISDALDLPPDLKKDLTLAALGHDTGKDRHVWQSYARNPDPTRAIAKSVSYGSWRELGGYRHEMGSAVDLGGEASDLTRHLVLTHHGNGRPSFSLNAVDSTHPEESREEMVRQHRRFAGLQRRYGWWGLAFLEAVLKSADGLASKPVATGASK